MSAPTTAETAEGNLGRPARPVRDPDPKRNAAYWARIDRIVATAPPLTDEQRCVIRAAFHKPRTEAA